MDRATGNLYARVFGAMALAALFMHVGMHLEGAFAGRVSAIGWVTVALFFVLAVAGAWAQARLNAKRAALWANVAVNGLLPIGAFLLHRAPLDAPGGYGIILLLALLFGALTMGFTGALLVQGQRNGSEGR